MAKLVTGVFVVVFAEIACGNRNRCVIDPNILGYCYIITGDTAAILVIFYLIAQIFGLSGIFHILDIDNRTAVGSN